MSPACQLHDPARHGNKILRSLFTLAHGSTEERDRMPPILVVANARSRRDATFIGLAIPGASDLRSSEDFLALWKVWSARRFQNYRAHFTVLNVPIVCPSVIVPTDMNRISSVRRIATKRNGTNPPASVQEPSNGGNDVTR
jgi:hypothetical protein